uniref:PIPK domain-containing protein n=1 Tax=Chromera velia CCMP2878 TaxID=1169474 RepID=A0A0G4I8B7_9ALVE|eukprot:Cvel_1983.t1-p1 / transcript=Cvel_1983.t1 / gene=Cvel_1983 / organism=Chromera_velia_CCMP2878 / gene_product=Probable phosphatidylinositol phosphate kinase, putative / transcript_product=Probable phosphatidylinositol phosphate kinase, putative / location=Cvel_scaffold75:86464-95407(-) / protein_length=1415 / sequence_SO=supercontig / SO=protein_coding / is_pseudo=false
MACLYASWYSKLDPAVGLTHIFEDPPMLKKLYRFLEVKHPVLLSSALLLDEYRNTIPDSGSRKFEPIHKAFAAYKSLPVDTALRAIIHKYHPDTGPLPCTTASSIKSVKAPESNIPDVNAETNAERKEDKREVQRLIDLVGDSADAAAKALEKPFCTFLDLLQKEETAPSGAEAAGGATPGGTPGSPDRPSGDLGVGAGGMPGGQAAALIADYVNLDPQAQKAVAAFTRASRGSHLPTSRAGTGIRSGTGLNVPVPQASGAAGGPPMTIESRQSQVSVKGKTVDTNSEHYALTLAMMLAIDRSLSLHASLDRARKRVQDNAATIRGARRETKALAATISKTTVGGVDFRTFELASAGGPASDRTGLPAVLAKSSLGVRFTDFAGSRFALIRQISGIDEESYRQSVCRTDFSFIEFMANSQSGQFFFFSHDGRYLIKTCKPSEVQLMMSLLETYSQRLSNDPRSLLMRVTGLHLVQLLQKKEENKVSVITEQFFLVALNVNRPKYGIHEQYDLKGSTLGRVAKEGESVFKDQDWIGRSRSLKLSEADRRAIAEVHQKDCEWLESKNLLDYSILLGVHDRSRARKGEKGVVRKGVKLMNAVDTVRRAKKFTQNLRAAVQRQKTAKSAAGGKDETGEGRAGEAQAASGGGAHVRDVVAATASSSAGPVRFMAEEDKSREVEVSPASASPADNVVGSQTQLQDMTEGAQEKENPSPIDAAVFASTASAAEKSDKGKEKKAKKEKKKEKKKDKDKDTDGEKAKDTDDIRGSSPLPNESRSNKDQPDTWSEVEGNAKPETFPNSPNPVSLQPAVQPPAEFIDDPDDFQRPPPFDDDTFEMPGSAPYPPTPTNDDAVPMDMNGPSEEPADFPDSMGASREQTDDEGIWGDMQETPVPPTPAATLPPATSHNADTLEAPASPPAWPPSNPESPSEPRALGGPLPDTEELPPRMALDTRGASSKSLDYGAPIPMGKSMEDVGDMGTQPPCTDTTMHPATGLVSAHPPADVTDMDEVAKRQEGLLQSEAEGGLHDLLNAGGETTQQQTPADAEEEEEDDDDFEEVGELPPPTFMMQKENARDQRWEEILESPLATVPEEPPAMKLKQFAERMHKATDAPPFGQWTSEDKQEVYFVGLIDFLTTYTFKKKAETAFKALRHAGSGGKAAISCVPPDFYASRQRDFFGGQVVRLHDRQTGTGMPTQLVQTGIMGAAGGMMGAAAAMGNDAVARAQAEAANREQQARDAVAAKGEQQARDAAASAQAEAAKGEQQARDAAASAQAEVAKGEQQARDAATSAQAEAAKGEQQARDAAASAQAEAAKGEQQARDAAASAQAEAAKGEQQARDAAASAQAEATKQQQAAATVVEQTAESEKEKKKKKKHKDTEGSEGGKENKKAIPPPVPPPKAARGSGSGGARTPPPPPTR